MNENIELVEYLYQNSKMGVYSLESLINNLKGKDNNIMPLLNEELKEYEKYVSEAEKIIEKSKYDVKDNNMMSKMSTNMGIKMEVMKDNSDSAIAHMLIEGTTMGIVDITSKIDKYSDVVDKKILSLAKDYLKFLEKEIEKLKEYL